MIPTSTSRASRAAQLKLLLGDGLGLDGAISTESSTVEVLGRRYRLDHGVVDFDGSLDPRLDIRMMHDFRSLTLTVDIQGRSSNPDLRLTSDSGCVQPGPAARRSSPARRRATTRARSPAMPSRAVA